MYNTREPITLHIKDLEKFKEQVLLYYHSNFINTHKDELERIQLMREICPDEANYLAEKIKSKYKPIKFTKDFECEYSVHPYCDYGCNAVGSVSVGIYVNDVNVYALCVYVLSVPVNKIKLESELFEEETLEYLKQDCLKAVEVGNKWLKSQKVETELDEAIDEIKSVSLKEKIRKLIKGLK
jgi:hypothetical protein